ncbi:MAG: InlB B-repeat-containing protein [Oscillospiraceae bacterium]|nr:InlB B-repeat-containing protein [Oscillospiraceae bacterium]
MNFRRRVTVTLLALLLLIGAIPMLSQPAQAATSDVYFDELQCAQFPMKTLHISRTNFKLDPELNPTTNKDVDPNGGHVYYAFDLCRGSTKVYAPFDMEIVSIGGDNSVIAQSLRPVRLADGRVDYLTCVFTHDNNISNIKIGKTFKQGTHFYDQGTKGNVDKHLHLEVAIGKPCSKSKSFLSNLQAVRDNGIHVHEAMFLSPDTKISKDYIAFKNGKIKELDWKTRQEIVFHSNVSGVADLTREYTLKEIYGSLPTPVNANKVFDGWYTAPKGGVKVTANTKVMSSHTHLYARWKDLPVKLNKNVTMKALSVTETDAKLSMTVKLSAGMNARKAGFYIGTNANYLTKSKKELTVKNTDLSKGVSFQISDYGFELQPGTKYYYRFYCVINGYEVCSKVASFTTKGKAGQPTTNINPKWSSYKAASITQNSATISAKVTYGKSVKVDRVGFYLGTTSNNLKKSTVYDAVNANRSSSTISYNLEKKGVDLNPNTTYYYQFYAIVGGKEYKSAVKSFKTKAGQQDTALNLTWSQYSAASITQNGATISAKVTYGKSVKVDRVGFYLGTTSNNLKKSTVYDAVNANRSSSTISYNLEKKGVDLNPNTTYYYQFYAIVGGKEYKSAVKSFKTKPGQQDTALNPTWSKYNATDITSTNATIGATVNYGKTLKADRCGFYLGTTQNNLKKATKYDTITQSRSYTEMWYDLNKYGQTLKPNTTYYYQFYIVIAGKEYKSAAKSFRTQGLTQQAVALTPTWSKYNATDITSTNATISATVNYGKTLKADSCGFYLGTTINNLQKATKYDTITQSRSYTEMWYDLNKYGHTLKPSTTYYYRLYLVVDGKEYLSDVRSFTTAKTELSPVWSDYKVSNISKTNATIAGKVTYGKTVKPERCGFYIGTSRDNLEMAKKYDTINASRAYSQMSYGMNKYGYTLKAGTTYYYRFYVVVNGVEYLSDIRSFTTSR